MPVGVTFGSVGDIISLSIVIKDLVKALDDSRGSSAVYQEIIRELWDLDRVRLEVELLWRTSENTVELNALRETARRMTDQCRHSIEEFLEKVKKYGPSLNKGGSGKIVRDVTMKIKWQIAHSDDLTDFRAEINAHCSAISMLLITANVNLTKANDQRLQARLADSDARNEASSDKQQLLLQEVKDKLDKNNKQIRAMSKVTAKISGALRLEWARRLGQEVKDWMRKIFEMNIATYNAVIDIRGRLPSHLERGLYQERFILEDGIGRIAPVHMQFICSWEAFDAVLELRFRNMQGYTMVRNKEYVIQESSTRREIDRSFPWEASFLPGQKVVMSMVFKDDENSATSCPRCHSSSREPQDSEIQCAGCGMWYRRITGYNYVDAPTAANELPIQRLREAPAIIGQSSFKSIVFGPPSPKELGTLMNSRKRKSEHNDIACFKRVRVLSHQTLVKKTRPRPGPSMHFAAHRRGFSDIAVDQANHQTNSKVAPVQFRPNTPSLIQKDNPAERTGLPPLPKAFQHTLFPQILCATMEGSEAERARHLATAESNEKVVNSIPEKDTTEMATCPQKQIALWSAVESGNNTSVESLLEHRVDLTVRDTRGRTLLHRAIANRRDRVAVLLLSKGHDVDAKDDRGQTPLHQATANGNDMVWLLLQFGADVRIKDDMNETPLDWALRRGSQEVIETLTMC